MKTNKDLVAWGIVLVWLVLNVSVYFLYGSDSLFFSNNAMVVIIAALILVKVKNERFNNWLNKDL